MPTDLVPTNLIARYDTLRPRHASYPKVPDWNPATARPYCFSTPKFTWVLL